MLLVVILIIASFFVLYFLDKSPSSDKSVNPESGAAGKVEFGMGDCMPCACNGEDCSGCPSRNCTPFNGEMFFVVKSKLDSLGNGNFTSLLESSTKTSVINGSYEITLGVDEYLVMPRDVYQYGNFINISSGKIVEQNFKFFKCTSY